MVVFDLLSEQLLNHALLFHFIQNVAMQSTTVSSLMATVGYIPMLFVLNMMRKSMKMKKKMKMKKRIMK